MKNCYTERLSPVKIAIADLCDYYGQGLIITRINVPREFRGQGHARKILQRIINDADKTQTTLWLEISPSDGLTYEQLQAWYLRYGFKRFRNSGVYYRRPQLH